MTRIRVFATLASLTLIACGTQRTGDPLDYLADCTPGRAFRECREKLERAPSNLFPAGRLEGISAELVLTHELHAAPGPGTRGEVVVYAMRFNVGRDDVLTVLEEALGERLGRGVPPMRTLEAIPGDYWRTEDGYWVCGKNAVAWYSHPFPIDESIDYAERADRAHLVPKTRELWDRIGRTLIGLDTEPRPPLGPVENDRLSETAIKGIMLACALVFLLGMWAWSRVRSRNVDPTDMSRDIKEAE